MKTVLLGILAVSAIAATPALSADLPIQTPPAPPPAPMAYNWTGCHAGLEAGGAFGSSQHIQDDPRPPAGFGLPLTNNFDVSGAVLGGTLGCDYQVSSWVIGIENDISWTNVKGSTNLIPPFSTTNTSETNEKWLDTLRLRAGYTWDNWFVYGTGGAAFSDVGITVCSPAAPACGSSSQTVTGWTAGVGAEYTFWRNWSAKIEYLHVDLGKTLFSEIHVGSGAYVARDVKLTNEIVRIGVDYKFDW